LPICSTVAPSGRRNIVSSCSSFDFALRVCGFGGAAPVAPDRAFEPGRPGAIPGVCRDGGSPY
jgi:hypothetical protein